MGWGGVAAFLPACFLHFCVIDAVPFAVPICPSIVLECIALHRILASFFSGLSEVSPMVVLVDLREDVSFLFCERLVGR